MNGMFDMGELVRRAIKYLVEGFMVAIAAFAIPQKQSYLFHFSDKAQLAP